MHVVIFEDASWTGFAPVALSKPVFMLSCGMSTLLEKQVELLNPSRLSLWVRPQLAEYCRTSVVPALKVPTTVNQPLDDQPALLVAARSLLLTKFPSAAASCAALDDQNRIQFASVRNMPGLSAQDALASTDRWAGISALPCDTAPFKCTDFLWQLIGWNEEAIAADFARLKDRAQPPHQGPWHLINPEHIRLGKDAKLLPGCVLDASKGPIFIDDGATIGANSVIQGPCYFGRQTTIHPLALIRPGVSIGAMCKICGEVSSSIVSDFTNKGHDGFLGDSYLGSWVNFGAGTTTSNLKNTYGEVTMRIGSKEFKTGRRMLGSLVGDHTKTAIGTLLNTGTYVGYNCLLAGTGLTPTFMPSFTFWTANRTDRYELKKAAEVADKVMHRRDKQWTALDESIQKYVAEVAVAVEK